MKKKITIKDIAEISGFNKSTVSRSLNDHPAISRETREKIKGIARQYNFEFNANARGLSLKKNNTIGIITVENDISTEYTSLLTSMVRRYFGERGMDALLCHAVNDTNGESNIRRLIRTGKVSGLFLLSNELLQDDWAFLKENPFPLVISHFQPKNATYEQFCSFFADNEAGGYLATEALIKAGKKRIITVTEGAGQLQFLHRTSGYYNALKQNGLERKDYSVIEGECSFEFGYQCIMDRRGLLPQIDGIFVQADVMAAGVLNALLDLGIGVPQEIGLVGFDDLDFCRYVRPSLTTIHQPRESMIKEACQCLFRQISNAEVPPSVHKVFSPRLMIRDSCPASSSSEGEPKAGLP